MNKILKQKAMKRIMETMLWAVMLLLAACSDDQVDELTPEAAKNNAMTLTTNKKVGEKIKLYLAALPEYQADVWIDLNNNGVKDAGEDNISFEVNKEYTLGSRTITIYGGVTHLDCRKNDLSELNVSNNPNLTKLSCFSTGITSLDVTKNAKLSFLNCGDTKISILDVSKNRELETLSCFSTGITSLDVSKNANLTDLSCFSTGITSLDVAKNAKLSLLHCADTKISILDVSKNANLTYLSCFSTGITSLDVSKNRELETLHCFSTGITSLDVSKNVKLTTLSCYSTSITALDLSRNKELRYLTCKLNPELATLNVANGHNKDFKNPWDVWGAFDATGCPKLKQIKVDKGFSTLVKSPPYNTPDNPKGWKKDAGAKYVE